MGLEGSYVTNSPAESLKNFEASVNLHLPIHDHDVTIPTHSMKSDEFAFLFNYS